MGACSRNPDCIDSPNVPVLKNLRTDLIDPDTPDSVKTRKSKTGKTQVLVVRNPGVLVGFEETYAWGGFTVLGRVQQGGPDVL